MVVYTYILALGRLREKDHEIDDNPGHIGILS
jgi:hypothetical protein